MISEYAGAADTLSGVALVEKSWHNEEFSKAMYEVLSMKVDERREKHEASIEHVNKHTRYVESFISVPPMARMVAFLGAWLNKWD